MRYALRTLNVVFSVALLMLTDWGRFVFIYIFAPIIIVLLIMILLFRYYSRPADPEQNEL